MPDVKRRRIRHCIEIHAEITCDLQQLPEVTMAVVQRLQRCIERYSDVAPDGVALNLTRSAIAMTFDLPDVEAVPDAT